MDVGETFVIVSWPEPPGSFISLSSIDYYQVLVGGWSDRIYVPQIVTAEEKTLKYEWLFPSTNYTLKVITVLKDGRRGCTDWIKFRTTGGKANLCFSKITFVYVNLSLHDDKIQSVLASLSIN